MLDITGNDDFTVGAETFDQSVSLADGLILKFVVDSEFVGKIATSGVLDGDIGKPIVPNEVYAIFESGFDGVFIVQIIILFGLSGAIRTIVQSGGPDVKLLGIVPSEAGLPYLPVVPLLAGLSSLVQGLAANRINPLQHEQSRAEKATTNGISISLSLFLAF